MVSPVCGQITTATQYVAFMPQRLWLEGGAKML
jgi:hypothetical protein